MGNNIFEKIAGVARALVLPFACVAAVACGDDDNSDAPFRLSRSEITMPVLGSGSVNISGGGGSYRADISDPELADVWIGDQNGNILYIVPKRAGGAVITVADGNGDELPVTLTVTSSVYALRILSYYADVEVADEQAKAEMEADVTANAPLPAGYSYVMSFSSRTGGDLEIRDSDTGVFEGTFFVENSVLTMAYNGITSIYYMEVARLQNSRMNIMPPDYERTILLKEDLTGHYRELYPEADVARVLRIQDCEESSFLTI